MLEPVNLFPPSASIKGVQIAKGDAHEKLLRMPVWSRISDTCAVDIAHSQPVFGRIPFPLE